MDPLLQGMLQNPVLNRRCAELQNETHMSSWGPRPILSRTQFNILRSCSNVPKRSKTGNCFGFAYLHNWNSSK